MAVSPSPAAVTAALHAERSGTAGLGPGLLPLLRQVVSADIGAVEVKPIKSGYVADVYRTVARPAKGAARPAPVIVKVIQPNEEIDPDGKTDPYGSDREANFYTAVLPQIGFSRPEIHFIGCDVETRARLVIMEDLGGFRNPDRTHRWTPEEAGCFIRAYARLHAAAVNDAHTGEPWLFRIRPGDLSPGETLEKAAALARRGVWSELAGLEDLLAWVDSVGGVLENAPLSYLHGDVFPPNVSLPPDLTGEAVLLDWDMAGIGPAEMDLAFMFLQPFGSANDLDRNQVLRAYWEERARIGGALPPPETRRLRQRYADALWGLYLIRVAHRSVFEPFPEGSPEDRYWQAFRPVLWMWLARISESKNQRIT